MQDKGETMTKYIKEYIKEVEKLKGPISKEELNNLKTKIEFFQHERLIHLLITLFFALLSIVFLLLINTNIIFIVLLLISLVLDIFYILHYFFLENSVQYLYKIYDKFINQK